LDHEAGSSNVHRLSLIVGHRVVFLVAMFLIVVVAVASAQAPSGEPRTPLATAGEGQHADC